MYEDKYNEGQIIVKEMTDKNKELESQVVECLLSIEKSNGVMGQMHGSIQDLKAKNKDQMI
jgi:hypothetical protein